MAEKTISNLGISDWREDRLGDLSGKLYVITGGNSGIGYEAAKMLGEKGADLILACRSVTKAQSAKEALETSVKGSVELVSLDLSDLSSVRAGAEAVRGITSRIDGLINNAGIMQTPQIKTKDGYELQFATNHLGHFLWTGLLLDLVEAAEARIVVVSSIAHKMGKKKIDFDDLMGEAKYSKTDIYAQSKLANLMFAFELDRRLQAGGSKAIAIGCHPGYSATNLQSTGPTGFLNLIYKPLNALMAQGSLEGARPTVLAAAEPEAKRGAYYGPTGWMDAKGPVSDAKVAAHALDEAAQKRLWEVSEELVGFAYKIGA